MSGVFTLLLASFTVSIRFSPFGRDEEQVAHVELRRLHFAYRICRHRRDVSQSHVDAALEGAEVLLVRLTRMLTASATAASITEIVD